MTPLTAIVLAGERPEGDPLAAAFGVAAKALIPVDGIAMGARVVATLRAHPAIGRVRVFGRVERLATLGGIAVEPSGPSIAATLAPLLAADEPLLVTTADHPLLSAAMLDAFLQDAEAGDVAIALVERRTLLAAYPGSRRTWLRFRKGAYSGANLFYVRGRRALPLLEVWRGVEQARKRGRAIVGAFGPLLLAGVALRLLGLDGALARVGRRFGLDVRAVVLPQAEACIDVDRVADHALVEAIVRGDGLPSSGEVAKAGCTP